MIDKKAQAESERYHNVYVAIHGDYPMVTTRNINLSLSYLQDSFESVIANRKLRELYGDKTPDREVAMTIREDIRSQTDYFQDENGHWYVVEKDGIEGSSQLIYDSQEKDFYYVDCSFPSHESPEENNHKVMRMREELMAWAKKNFDVDESEVSFHTGAPIPYRHYEIHKLSEYPGVFNFMRRNGINIEVDSEEKMVFVDCDNIHMRELAEEIGYNGEDFWCTESAFRYVGDDDRELFRVNPPFYFVNTAGKGRVAVTRAAVLLIMKRHLDESIRDEEVTGQELLQLNKNYTKYLMEIDLDTGVSFGKLMYDNSSAAYDGGLEPPRSVSVSLDGESDANEDWVSHYSLEGNEKMIDFVRYFKFMVNDLFPFEDHMGSAYNRTYYYIAKRRPDAVNRYQVLFDEYFEMGDSFETGEYVFDVIYSWYSVPEKVLTEFGYESVCDQKVYDHSINIVTRSMEYAQAEYLFGKERDSDYELYQEHIDEQVFGVIENTNRDDFIMNSMSQVGDVRNILDYPMVYSEISEMFRNRGVKYQDLPVILVRDTQNPGMRGGYVPAASKGEGGSKLMGFDPPYIMVNLANTSNKTNDDIADVLVHEGSHFIDDLMVQQGLEKPDVMHNPPRARNEEDMIRFWREYLSSPTEFTAHMVQAFMGLRSFSREKVKRDANLIIQDIIRKVFLPGNRSQIFLTQDAYSGATDVEINVNDLADAPVGTIVKGMVDVVEGDAVSEYKRTGLKMFDSVVVEDIDADEGVVYFRSPLSYPAAVSEGAHLSYPSVNDFKLEGETTQLYADIVSKAVEYYVDGGTFPPRGV